MERIEAWSPSSPATSQSPSTNAPSSSSASVADGAERITICFTWRERFGRRSASGEARGGTRRAQRAGARAVRLRPDDQREITRDGGRGARLHPRRWQALARAHAEILAEQRHRRQQLAAEVEAVREAEMKRPLAPPHAVGAWRACERGLSAALAKEPRQREQQQGEHRQQGAGQWR